MKIFKHIGIALSAMLLAVGCSDKMELSSYDSQTVEGTPVVVDLGLWVPKESGMPTRVMAEGTDGNNLMKTIYAIVFDENGLLLEAVKGEPGIYEDNPKKTQYDVRTDTLDGYYYTPFHVVLHATSRPRIVHIVGNYTPQSMTINTESTVFSKMYVKDSLDAYWQRVSLPNGIKMVEVEIDGNTVEKADEQTLKDFRNIPLVRNFLKVNVTVADSLKGKFTILGYYVFNRPNNGTIAPYNANATVDNPSDPLANRFADYVTMNENNLPVTKSYEDLVNNQQYYGFEPEEMTLADNPIVNQGGDGDNSFPFVDPKNPTYMYERNQDKTTTDPSFIIIKGQYDKDSTPSYYKADFVYPDSVEEGNIKVKTSTFYHLLRNMSYTLNIREVKSRGTDYIYDAVHGQAMNNVSVSSVSADLTNISSDEARLYVQYTDELFTKEGQVTLKYKHIPDKDNSSTTGNKVKNTEDVVDGEAYVILTGANDGNVLENGYTLSYGDDNDGFRTITFNLKALPEKGTIAKQTITITSSTGLVRDVVFEYSKPLELKVTKTVSGENVEVNITIPAGISERRFPLTFNIDCSNNNIYPNVQADGFKEMPVELGSIDGSTTYGDYYYNRTISWSEYNGTTASTDGYKTFKCYFKKVNTSATEGDIRVKGNSYFKEGIVTATK